MKQPMITTHHLLLLVVAVRPELETSKASVGATETDGVGSLIILLATDQCGIL